jgi:hypothetical protein
MLVIGHFPLLSIFLIQNTNLKSFPHKIEVDFVIALNNTIRFSNSQIEAVDHDKHLVTIEVRMKVLHLLQVNFVFRLSKN